MVKLECKPAFSFAFCVACLILPLKLLAAWFCAVFIHELGHYLALRITKTKIYRVSIGAMGANMETEPMTEGNTLFCALAGPAFGFLLLFAARWFPLLAICGLIQSCYNLLPLFPLDGGRVLHCLLHKLPGQLPQRFIGVVESLVLGALILLSIYLTFRLLLGPLPVLVVVFLCLRRKLSCKQQPQRVQ